MATLAQFLTHRQQLHYRQQLCIFVLAFCFTCKHAETKLKQNNFTETKHCFVFVLFQFYFRCNHCITFSTPLDFQRNIDALL